MRRVVLPGVVAVVIAIAACGCGGTGNPGRTIGLADLSVGMQLQQLHNLARVADLSLRMQLDQLHRFTR